MKHAEKILNKLNDLLIMNYEVEKIYLESLKTINDSHLKSFFRERGFERHEFSNELKLEIEKLDGQPSFSGRLSADFYKTWMNFRNLLMLNDESDLMDEVCHLKQLSIDKYNTLLSEIGLPLSVCKLLVKQRDSIQVSMNAIKRQEASVA